MKFLVIGLGSMGKRRIRCLQALGYSEIVGLDLRADRRLESSEKYKIKTISDLKEITISEFDAFIVSTPPDKHTFYAKIAIDHGKPAFIEASVLLEEVVELKNYNKNNIFLAPSCTLRFHQTIKDITKIIKDAAYGKVTNFSYHSGQYLPDWHPWENINDFYVSNRSTGGAREIVPFELTWIVDSLGFPKNAKGYFRKTIELKAGIEDTYCFSLEYEDAIGSITVDVAARYATRNLIINLESAQIKWSWDESCFKVFESKNNRWVIYQQGDSSAAEGYNKNIGEKMYIDEIESFIKGISDKDLYPNTIEDDIRILEILDKIEKSDGGFNR